MTDVSAFRQPEHERADWRNEARTIADRLDRYLFPQRYDHGPEYVWNEWTPHDVADTVTDYRNERSRRARGAADAPADEARTFAASSAYSLSACGPDRWEILRGDTRVTKLTLKGTEDFLNEIDAGASEQEATRRAVSRDLSRRA